MSSARPPRRPSLAGLTLLSACLCASAIARPSDEPARLAGRAILPALTFADGPTSGQLITPANGITPPFPARQPVQGLSAVLAGPRPGTFLVMPDNGFGAKANSPDALLRLYAVQPDFARGEVSPVDMRSGAKLASFEARSFISLRDPDRRLPFPIVADAATYPGTSIPVAAEIRSGRLLTGADFDIESVRRAADGTFWFGDEFGPFLLHTDGGGRVLEAPWSLPNFRQVGANDWVQSPDNPLKPADVTANLGRSRGFEGMALSWDGGKLYALLEGALVEDPHHERLLLNEFDLADKRYTGKTFAYRLESAANSIGDLTAVGPERFVVIERDNFEGAAAKFKKVYKLDLRRVDADGFLIKEEIADLMDLADPHGIGGSDSVAGRFSFPFQTIEDVLPLDAHTLLLIDDNNFPFSNGRVAGRPDNSEFIKVTVQRPLNSALKP